MNIPLLRSLNQQLLSPQFSQIEDLVDWMGAMQAQNFSAVKWAVGTRLKVGTNAKTRTLQKVEESLKNGTLVRTHVLRPTWHLVAGKHIRWMLQLSRESNERLCNGFLKSSGVVISKETYAKSRQCLTKALEGHKSLTLQELTSFITQSGIPSTNRHVKAYLWDAEGIGLICNGRVKGSQNTYSLLDEQVPAHPVLTREEALVQLANLYFRSHSPATLDDYVWWSGLKKTEVKLGVQLLADKIHTETIDGTVWYYHDQSRLTGKGANSLALLPAFDEYILGYTDRTHVLPKEFYSKAFNTFGIFYPVIMYKGQIIGNWEASANTKGIKWTQSYFRETPPPDELLEKETNKYATFYGYAH